MKWIKTKKTLIKNLFLIKSSSYFVLSLFFSVTFAETVFEVRPNEGLSQISYRLQKKRLINYPLLFKVLAKGLSYKLKVGEYDLKKDASYFQILKILSSGKSKKYLFLVPEGYSSFDMQKKLLKGGFLSAKNFLEICFDKKFLKKHLKIFYNIDSCEGFLFPETYTITKYTRAETLMKQMFSHFLKHFRELKLQFRDGNKDILKLKLSDLDLVTLASIVEKETGASFERPLIASVFFNRLKKSMKLQSDPTILYSLQLQLGYMPTNIRKKDILHKSQYNTYYIKGLPKGPIANPGRKALEAVFQPEKSNFLFFVSKNDGTHFFSKDYKTHKAAVNTFQKNPKARKGRSWRDLKKK